jgi:hypothetical protein
VGNVLPTFLAGKIDKHDNALPHTVGLVGQVLLRQLTFFKYDLKGVRYENVFNEFIGEIWVLTLICHIFHKLSKTFLFI